MSGVGVQISNTGLSLQVSRDEWESIPDIGDYTIKKQKRMQSFVPVPDTLLSKVIMACATKCLAMMWVACTLGVAARQLCLSQLADTPHTTNC